MKKILGTIFGIAICLSASPLRGQQTTAFTYQGQLRDGSTNANGTYGLTFKLFDAVSGGNQVGGTLTSSALLVNGLFSVNLDFGSAFDGGGRWLGITVQAGTNASETLAPRVQVLPAPYALYATKAGTVTNGAIMNAQLAASAIATANIQNNAVTTAQIADGAVTNRNLAANAVTTTNIQANAILTAQIANGAVTNPKLAANAVAMANIQDAAVSDAKIVTVSGGKVVGTVASAAILTNGLWRISVEPHEGSTRLEFTKEGTNWMSVGERVFINTHLQVEGGDISTDGNLFVSGNLSVGGTSLSAIPRLQVFNAAGTFVVPTNITRIMVEVWGGGGGGGGGGGDSTNGSTGGGGGGGGGGGYGKDVITVTPGSSMPVSVGLGGTGGANGGIGGNGAGGGIGGTSSLGSVSASGGAGGGGGTAGSGSFGSPGNGGAPGSSSATIAITGGSGLRGFRRDASGSSNQIDGAGGNGAVGGGADQSPGGGGSFNGSFARSGAPARVIIWY